MREMEEDDSNTLLFLLYFFHRESIFPSLQELDHSAVSRIFDELRKTIDSFLVLAHHLLDRVHPSILINITLLSRHRSRAL
ncbi:unnamed protein product [Brugia timori]|uniref:Uncharacterized protein n=1 Tax=Brugia timori TaxID=42155 RepID=A0A0R3QG86_9BILA|nr:unnamed protein product [Brugia timori]